MRADIGHRFVVAVRSVAIVLSVCLLQVAGAQNAAQGSFPFLIGTHVAAGPTMKLKASAGASLSGVIAGSAHRIEWTMRGSVLIAGGPTHVAFDPDVPTTSALFQNFPNPFNLETTLRYSVAEPSIVRISVFNLLGQVITIVEEGDRPAGVHQRVFDAAGLSSGVYYYRLEAKAVRSSAVFTSTRQMLLLK